MKKSDSQYSVLERIKCCLRKLRMMYKAKRKFHQDMVQYNCTDEEKNFKITKKNLYPRYQDIYKNAGEENESELDEHYFLQDIYMASKIHSNAPSIHYDIGSRIGGFIAHLISASTIEKIIMIDIRPFFIKLPRFYFRRADATNLRGIAENSIQSLSSLHAVEHFGLGRYGDNVDPQAWRKALKSIQRVMGPGGYFYLSVPVGPQNKLCFIAHRIFRPSLIIETLDKMELLSFAYIHNWKVIEVDIKKNLDNIVHEYDCGMFIFKKR